MNPKNTEDAARIRRLTRFNYFWLSLVIFGSLTWLISRQVAAFQTVNVSWEADGGITFSPVSDGPFVITDLILVKSTTSETEMTIAQLTKPIVIIESGNVNLSKQEVDKLVWYERSSRETVASPVKGSPIRALYYKALKTAQAE